MRITAETHNKGVDMPQHNKHHKVQKKNDVDYAFLSIALGAGALFSFLLTALPAIVVGIIALKKKSGNPAQAKWGIALGVSSIVIAAVVIVGAFLIFSKITQPLYQEQQALPEAVEKQLQQATEKLKQYHHANGSYPTCRKSQTANSCTPWLTFTREYQVELPGGGVVFSDSENIAHQPVGTVVYATKTTCYINGPVRPDFLSDEKFSDAELSRYATLVYYHEKGRSCFSATAHVS